MTRIIGDRRENTLDEMEEVSRARNRDVAEEERMEKLEALKRAKEEAERKQNNPMAPSKTPAGRFLGNPKGLLYGGRNGTRNTLKYHVLKEDELKEDFALKDTTGAIHAIYARADEEVYFADNEPGDNCVRTLFGGSIYSREHYITAIQDHDGRIIDASLGGVKDTISGQVVFADAKVQSLSSHGQYMFALIDTGNYGYYFEGIASRRGFNYCGSVLEYKCGNSIISQAICVPYVSRIGGKEIPFSIVSCAYHDILDINGETVKGTVMNKSDICRLALLGCKDNIADVAYGATLGAIYVARLDLKDKTLVDKSILVSDTGDSVLSLFAVHNEKMHEKLVRMGKIKRVEDLLIGDEKE